MTQTNANIIDSAADGADSGARTGWFATGGLIGAILASSCCIVPLVLVTIGVSGAWIGTLTALEPYKPLFAGATLIFSGWRSGGSISGRSRRAQTVLSAPARHPHESPNPLYGPPHRWLFSP